MTEDEMVGWHHQLNGHEFEQTPGVGDGQGSVLQSMGSQRVGHNLATEQLLDLVRGHDELRFELCKLWIQRRQWHPTPVLLPGKSRGWRSLVGCSPWGR